MANADKPKGFQFAYTKHGGPPLVTRYYTAGTAIYKGDVLKLSNGRVAPVTAVTDAPMGVAAAYNGSTDETSEVFVYDDLQNTVFQAQADTSQIAGTSLVNTGKDITITAGSSLSDLSQQEVDVSASCVGYVWILDKVGRPDNDWGSYVDLYVEILAPENMKTSAWPAS